MVDILSNLPIMNLFDIAYYDFVTMTTPGPVSYVRAYFVHLTLTQTRGEPTFSTLRDLKKQLRANASRVILDLEGGAHGHL